MIDKGHAPPHTQPAADVAAALGVRSERGLHHAQAHERLARVGPSCLPQPPPRSRWQVLRAQFKSLLIVILLGAAGLAALVGSFKDALVILAVVLVNAFVGFTQEYHAERSLAAQRRRWLTRLQRDRATMIQDALDSWCYRCIADRGVGVLNVRDCA